MLQLAVLHLNPPDMDPLNLRPSVKDTGVEAPRRDEPIHKCPRASVPDPRHMGFMNTQRAGTSERGLYQAMFLIHAIGESHGDPAVKSWSMHHTEVERRNSVIEERRGENTFTIFVTVSSGISPFSFRPQAPCEGLSFLGHSCSLRRRKQHHVIPRPSPRIHAVFHPHTISIAGTRQRVQRDAAPMA